MTYTDQTVYQLLVGIAAHDVTVTMLDFDPTDAFHITCDDRRALVSPSEDGTRLEWQLLQHPCRGRWRFVNSGSGGEAATRTAVLGHLRAAQLS